MKKMNAFVLALVFCLLLIAFKLNNTVEFLNIDSQNIEIINKVKVVQVEVDGRNGVMKIEVKATPNRIEEINIIEHRETTGVTDLALEEMPNRIKLEQSIKVDIVSGSTITCNAIILGVENALIDMGYDLSKFDNTIKRELIESPTESTDIIIIGAGLSGLMSGIELTKNYPDINFIILEQLPFMGGSLSLTGGSMFALNSKYHVEQAKVSTVNDVVEYFKSSSKQNLNENLIRNVFAISGETFDWIADMGNDFEKELVPSTIHSDKLYVGWTEGRTSGGGARIYHTISKYIYNLKMDVRLDSKVTELIIENGAVVGVKVEDNEKKYDIMGKAVLLQTGGFGNSREMMKKYALKYSKGVKDVNVGANGDGFKFVEQFGTNIVGDGTMGTFYTKELKEVEIVPFMVNSKSKRFVNETEQAFRIQRIMADETDGNMFLITDSKYKNLDAIEKQVKQGIYKKYDSLQDLAKDLKLDENMLLNEIEKYNKAVENNKILGFGLQGEKAHPIKEAPFYGVHTVIRTFATIPGIEINADMQVLDKDRNIIPNLYAAGELTAGNAFSYQYPGEGMGISYASNSGRLAAMRAAEYISK